MQRFVIFLGMALGAAWAVALLKFGSDMTVPIAMIQPVLMGALFAPGLVLLLMIAVLGLRRFFDRSLLNGEPFWPDSHAQIDQRVLTNTVEQIALALCIWPLAGFFLGAGIVAALGIGFAAARLLFWLGYHIWPPLRAFGFAATFYPTIGAAGLVLWSLAHAGF